MCCRLMMNIDDQEILNKNGNAINVVTERPIYLGGTDFTVEPNLVGASQPFGGCISDVTVNGK